MLISIIIAKNLNILQRIKTFFIYVHFLKVGNLRADATST